MKKRKKSVRKHRVKKARERSKKNIFRKVKIIYIIVGILIIAVLSSVYLNYFYNANIKEPEIIKEEISIVGRSFIFSKRADVTNAPVIILLHGGLQDSNVWFGENPQNSQALFAKNAIKKGYAVIAPDSIYPLCKGIKQWDYREDSSDLPFFDEIFNWIWLREELDSERVYVAGMSIGGFMASRLSHHYGNNINAVAIHSGGNADNVFIHPDNYCYVEYRFNQTNIKDNHPRTLLIHGINDSIIPYQSTLTYYFSLKKSGAGVQLLGKEGGEHNWYKEFNDVILEWFS